MLQKELLANLHDEETPLKYSRLVHFSGLTSDELAELKALWLSVPTTRKKNILGRLVELSEDNLELDFDGVFRASLEDADEDVRERATQGLWECEDRAVIRPLIDLLTNDPSARVRAAVGISLGKLSAMAQNGRLLPRDSERIREALMAVIARTNEDSEVRRRAIEAVACFDFPETHEIILEAYRSGERNLRQSSIYAMGQSCDTRWTPVVVEEMDHQDPAFRYEAATACGHIGDQSTVPHLIKLIQDEDLQVQTAAIKALGAVGGPLAKRALQQCLKIGDEALEEAAQEALSDHEFDENPLGLRFEA